MSSQPEVEVGLCSSKIDIQHVVRVESTHLLVADLLSGRVVARLEDGLNRPSARRGGAADEG